MFIFSKKEIRKEALVLKSDKFLDDGEDLCDEKEEERPALKKTM